jgi:octaprenyl-diphosphate synthase
MAVGELLQLTQAGRPGDTLLSYLRIIEGKTSALFAWACTAGDLCPPPARSSLRRFGRRFGMAFQIADDILDYVGDPALTGKVLGSDLREGKVTLPLYLACSSDPGLRAAVEEICAVPDMVKDARQVERIVERVRSSRGVERARGAAETLLARAHRALDELPTSPWQQRLHDLADFVVTRSS